MSAVSSKHGIKEFGYIEFDKVWLYCAISFIREGKIRLAIEVGKVVAIEVLEC